jgi:hypothetical protein
METLKNARTKYKNGTSLLDLGVKLIIKVIELANKNMLGDADRVNRQIKDGDLSKLKKFSPVLVDPLKNYMTLTSSFASLIASSHSANYDRKMIIKTLLKHLQEKTKDISGKRADYLSLKVNAMEKHFEDALDQLEVVINAVKFFAGMYVRGAAEKPDDEADDLEEGELEIPEVTSLSGIVKVLAAIKKKLESHYSEIKSMNKNIRQLFAKKGSFENMLTQQYDNFRSHVYANLITGGVDPKEDYHLGKTYIIGGNGKIEMYVGGHLTEQDIDVKTTWMTAYQDNSKEMTNNPSYEAMMNKKLDRIFGGIEESINMDNDEYFEKLLKDCKVDEVLDTEIENILKSGFLEKFRDYYFKHKRQYLDSDPDEDDTPKSDEHFKFEREIGDSTDDKLTYITDFMSAILNALDQIDVAAITLSAEKHFTHLKDADNLVAELETLDGSVKMSQEKRELLFNRRDLKAKIRKHIDEALEESAIGGRFQKLDKPSTDESIGTKTEYLLKRQMSVKGALNASEHASLDKARGLCQAIRSALSLMSAENKDSCICKAVNLVKGLVYADTLDRMMKEVVAKDRISKAKKELLNIGKLSDVKLYDCGLCTKEITDIAVKLVL